MAFIRQPSTNHTTDTSLTVLVDALQYDPGTYYEITLYCYKGSTQIGQRAVNFSGYGSAGNWRTDNWTFTGLSSGTTYEFYAMAKYYSYSTPVRIGSSSGSSSVYFTTTGSSTPDPPPLTVGQVTGLTATGYTNNSISLSWNHASEAWYYQIQYSPNGSTWYDSATRQSNNYWTVTGLSPATTYYFRVRGYQGSTYGRYSSIISARTLTNAPTTFEWTYPKVAGQNFNLTAQEWNAFTSKINQWRQYKGYTDWTFTTVYKGDIVYADIYNEARNGIAGLSPSLSIPAKVYTGDDILAYHFNRIRDCLNSVSS